MKERDWDNGKTSLDEPGSHAGVEQSHKKYGDGGEGDWEAEGVPASGRQNPCRSRGSVTDVKQLGLSLQGDERPPEQNLDKTATKREAVNDVNHIINAILV